MMMKSDETYDFKMSTVADDGDERCDTTVTFPISPSELLTSEATTERLKSLVSSLISLTTISSDGHVEKVSLDSHNLTLSDCLLGHVEVVSLVSCLSW